LLEKSGRGQWAEATPVGLQVATSSAVPLMSLVQSVQWEVTPALTGITSSTALKGIAAKLPSKSIFLHVKIPASAHFSSGP